ncbi:hypothetical protein QUC31_002191 [Theobroma cacao]
MWLAYVMREIVDMLPVSRKRTPKLLIRLIPAVSSSSILTITTQLRCNHGVLWFFVACQFRILLAMLLLY